MSGIASVADVSPHYEDTRAAWLAAARAAAVQLGQGGAVVTVEDVRRVCPPPPGSSSACLGAVFRTPGWERVGWAAARRESSHGRVLAQFRLQAQGRP